MKSEEIELHSGFSFAKDHLQIAAALGETHREHSCLRRLVVAYNAFFWVTGPGLIGLGIWLIIKLGDYEPVVERAEFLPPAYIIISAGSASVLAGLVGCLGGLNENRRLLYVYSVLMFVVCAADVTATVLCFLGYDKAEDKLSTILNSTLQNQYGADADLTDGMDSLQKDGCLPALVDWLHRIYIITGWSVAGVGASMILALSAVCCLKHALSTFYYS